MKFIVLRFDLCSYVVIQKNSKNKLKKKQTARATKDSKDRNLFELDNFSSDIS